MHKRCILCADPDPELRSNLGFLLAGENCVLEEAAGGATLLTQLRRSTDLVILPQQLPDMSGFDACTALRRCCSCWRRRTRAPGPCPSPWEGMTAWKSPSPAMSWRCG